jgi:hypothetical protein
MNIARKIRRALRGEVGVGAAMLEAGRRVGLSLRMRRERARLNGATKGGVAFNARLAHDFARMSDAELLAHFRTRATPRFFEGFDDAETANAQGALSREELAKTFEEAREIVNHHRWPLLGYGVLDFGARVDWLREPVLGARWPLDFHGDVALVRGDGSDVRVLWELNRLGQLLTLARAYALTRDESLAEEFFAQVESWRAQNPAGFGPNWACAMEVSLRALNLLASFQLFRRSHALDARRLASMLALFDEHGRHVRRNLEFSFIATGNHYLSDVTGLLWLGLLLPELRDAAEWRAFALRELLRELDKQVLPDGADCEASTGYQRFVTELFLYSFILCRANAVVIEERHLRKLRSMLEYIRAYLRPDGRAPLIGDADSGRALALAHRAADEHAYLLAVGAVFFCEPRFKTSERAPEELFWLLGASGVQAYAKLETAQPASSAIFEHAGVCVLREADSYLLMSASGAGLRGRGAHGHNDALSLEVSACGVSFIADPGTYVYTSDLAARQLFRSTAYHSTVEIDGVEQNRIAPDTPFLIGDEARPRLLSFTSDECRDSVVAEHRGYERLDAGAIKHTRSVIFDKRERYWLVEDSFDGSGAHVFNFRFHAAPERETRVLDGSTIEISDDATGARLFIASLSSIEGAQLEPRFASRDYGSRTPTRAALWTLSASAPLRARWLLLPVCTGEDEAVRLELIERLREESEPPAVAGGSTDFGF